ncbi:hypothetical protein [Fusobacterium periodonticum]|uniref:hypothetical protein n=1 Tax=Fusobacterium periodonticum TaxID=860 RepID=UPI00195AC9A0|nr:hypothetical protein [Fusobacterium periodonticum]VTX73504.1 Uncharacterised protein [Fusobacterium periodonticum]
MKDEKGIILPIYDDKDNWIGNILINEKLEVIDNLKNGYHIKRGLNNEWKIKAKKQKK